MHEENLKDAIFNSVFQDEDMYRRHYIPVVRYMRKNPDDQDRVAELVDNATMRYCKNNRLDYRQIPQEAKEELVADMYTEILENEIGRGRN